MQIPEPQALGALVVPAQAGHRAITQLHGLLSEILQARSQVDRVQAFENLARWVALRRKVPAVAGALPEERPELSRLRMLLAALQALPEAEQQATIEWLQQKQQEALAAMDPEEREAAVAELRRQQIEQQAANAEQATQAVLQSKDTTQQAELAQQLIGAAEHFAEGEAEGSPYAELALFLQALAALLRKEALPALPSAYQARINDLIELIKD